MEDKGSQEQCPRGQTDPFLTPASCHFGRDRMANLRKGCRDVYLLCLVSSPHADVFSCFPPGAEAAHGLHQKLGRYGDTSLTCQPPELRPVNMSLFRNRPVSGILL